MCLCQVFLDHRSKDEVALLVSTRTNGATPMLMACRNGHLDVVEYLFERCDADIEQSGSGITYNHLLLPNTTYYYLTLPNTT